MSSLKDFVDELKNDIDFTACVSRWEVIAPNKGEFRDLPDNLDSLLVQALKGKRITKLYSHQRECYDAVSNRQDIVIVTPTASGKTLCYNLPILDHILKNPDSRALYLFPTKALSQDQQAVLNEIVLSDDIGIKIHTYDGDTPATLRRAARENARIVISNPDMLHSGILPNHTKWSSYFKSLKYIVIDEIHTYRGVFGSHLTNLLRRLKRIAAFYGSDPVFICCSATIGNPRELSESIIEKKALLIDKNGAPSGERHFILYNPPLVDTVQGIRRGVVNESNRLAVRLLSKRIKTIVFARSRVMTELIASYINKSMQNHYNDNNRIAVEPYRGGFLPGERRKIEKGLRDGSINGVVSTNALELGIDIGGLDAVIMAGMPGSVSSAWQQAGRSGRSGDLSMAILVASSSPDNQYLVHHPEYFFSRSPESGFIDANNMYILLDHLKCAVFEKPFHKDEGFPEPVTELLDYLETEGVLRLSEDTYYWADRSYPAEQVSLRSATAENVVIIDKTSEKNNVIGEMDWMSAREMLFDNAIYIHHGVQYVVKKLDLENHSCHIEQARINFYTDALVKTDIKVLEDYSEERISGILLKKIDILVRSQVSKYKKLRFHTHENIGYGEVFVPEAEMHTSAAVILFSEGTEVRDRFDLIDQVDQGPVMTRIARLIRNTAPLFLLCDRQDIGVNARVMDPHFKDPCIIVYDKYPGGIGLSDGFIKKHLIILNACYELINQCSCEMGCPSCVGPMDRNENFTQNPKEVTKQLLKNWIEVANKQ